MSHFLLKRLLQGAGVVCAAIIVAFFGTHVIGDPLSMILNQDASPAHAAKTAHAFGFDQPLPIQFLRFISDVFTNDLGDSFIYGKPALSLVLSRLPATFELAFLALFITLFLGLPAGLRAGLRPDGAFSRIVTLFAITGFSIPIFWVGLLFIGIFSIAFGLLPSAGRGPTTSFLGMELSIFTLEGLRYALLPALSLALYKTCLVIRLIKTEAAHLTTQSHLIFAHAQGLGPFRICVRVLKNVMGPIITVIGLEFSSLIALSIVTETLFSWPGSSRLLLEAILKADRPVIVAYGLIMAIFIVTLNILTDSAQYLLTPRTRTPRETLPR